MLPEEKGRTARKVGNEKSGDQKSGLVKALPKTAERTRGSAIAQPEIHSAESWSARVSQESGRKIRASRLATQTGKTCPLRRHSNQNCAPAAEGKDFVRRGSKSSTDTNPAFKRP